MDPGQPLSPLIEHFQALKGSPGRGSSHYEEIPHEFHQALTYEHGRIDFRRHWLLEGVEHLIDAERWVG